MPLEGPDEYISLARAAQISGLASHTLSIQARAGKLHSVQPIHDRFTTRRWLHAYLLQRDQGPRKPLPADYLAPGEPTAPAYAMHGDGADEYITLKRASEIAGVSPHTLSAQAQRGKLQTIHLRSGR